MKPGKLYLKIFLSFLGVIVIIEILIFALFLAVPGRYFRERVERFNRAKTILVKQVVEDKIKTHQGAPFDENTQLKTFVEEFADTVDARVWITGHDGNVLLKSFKRNVPTLVDELKRARVKTFGSTKYYRHHGFDILTVVPLVFPGGKTGHIYLLFDRVPPSHPERKFALGLAVIGLVVAVLVIPIARFITKPLNHLRQSALRIADGELSRRADVTTRDEIGELCAAFNHMADRVERMIRGGKELTANVSHELRTPLARIRLAEELIGEQLAHGRTADLDRLFAGIRVDIQELDRLIGSILDLSKSDIHETPLNVETFNPRELMADLLERQRTAADHQALELTRHLDFDRPFSGDREAMASLFSIVLDNALKFTPEKGRVSVTMAAAGQWMETTVVNSFHPLPEEDLSRIFEPFYRAENSPARGTGLGLAIARKIVEKHGGTITARNTPHGFSIRIRLPLNRKK